MLDLGSFDALEEGRPTLRKAEGRRFVCVKEGGALHVLDDRCPHQGYPLSGGQVRDGVLTCCWHNWKFELATGACTFGGEAVGRYEAEVRDGRIRVSLPVVTDAQRQQQIGRLGESLARQQREGSFGSTMRQALRLEALGGEPFEVVAVDLAARAPWGFEHGLAMLADAVGWVDAGTVERGPAFAAVSQLAGEPLIHARPRPSVEPIEASPSALLDALRDEQRERAEGIARGLVRAGRVDEMVEEALVPFLARDLVDYGHGAIFTLKALELAQRFPDAAEAFFASLVVSLGWATFDSALPGWGATHGGTRQAEPGGHRDIDVEPYVESVLASEKHAVTACLEALRCGTDPMALLQASARAAAIRLTRFDDHWQFRLDAPVTILNVSHALTFAEAALRLPASRADRARLAVQSAGFVGKLRAADLAETSRTPARLGGDLAGALSRRDLAEARAAVGELTHEDFVAACAEHALHHGFVRPIFAAHAVKTAEVCFRLERRDPPGAPYYREALVTLIAPRRPERVFHRTAHIAAEFIKDPADGGGRPPVGLW